MHPYNFTSAPLRKLALVVLALGFSCATCLIPFAQAQKTAQPARRVVTTVKPDYPPLLKHEQIGGLVRLGATVLPDGTVTKVEIRGGNPILAECAAAAVMKWKYAPASSQTVEEVSLSFSPH